MARNVNECAGQSMHRMPKAIAIVNYAAGVNALACTTVVGAMNELYICFIVIISYECR